MNSNRYPTNSATTTHVTFAVQQRWTDSQSWSDVRWISASHSAEKAIEKAARYRKEIDRGDYEGVAFQPALRIVQRVSEWTPLSLEV